MKKLLRIVPVALFAITSLALSLSLRPQVATAQIPPPGAPTFSLTSACSSDPCASTSYAYIQVPGGSSMCTFNVYGTFEATGVYETTNSASPTSVLAQWQLAVVSPSNNWLANTGFSTATSRAFQVLATLPARSVSYVRVRLSAYTSGTVSVQPACAGRADNITAIPGDTPTSSPTP
jgi:hypothetical protein